MATPFSILQEKLKNVAREGQIPHAQVFIAQEGMPVLSLVLLLIQQLHCLHPSQAPCQSCSACLRLTQWQHPDLHCLFPLGSNKEWKGKEVTTSRLWPTFQAFLQELPYGGLRAWSGYMGCEAKHMLIPKEAITDLRHMLAHKPFESHVKTIMVWLPEHLTRVAANTMLKIVEEPTPHTFFFFISYHKHDILPTLLSRLWPVYLPPLETPEVFKLLKEQFGQEEETRLEQVAILSNGNLHKAHELLQQTQLNYFAPFAHWLRCIYASKLVDLLELAEKFHDYSITDQKNWLEYGSQLLQQALHTRFTSDTLALYSKEEASFCRKLGATLSSQALQAILEALSTIQKNILGHAHAKLTFLHHSLALCEAIRS